MTPKEKSQSITFGKLKELKFSVPEKFINNLYMRGEIDKRHQTGNYIFINGKDLVRHILRELNN